MTTKEMREVTIEGEHLCTLAEPVLHSWPSTKTEVHKQLQHYCSFWDEIAIIDRIAIKGRRIIKHTSLQGKAIK